MSRVRELMIDNVIRRYGFENKKTIKFCRVAETEPIEEVERVYHLLMKA